MNKKPLLLLLGGLLCVSYPPVTVGQEPTAGTHDLAGPVRLLWEARYDGPFQDKAYSMAASPLGDLVFVTGSSQSLPFCVDSADFTTIAYGATTGERIWLARYDGPAGGRDQGRSVAVSPQGDTVFVAGPSAGLGSGVDCATLAYDSAAGSMLWAARYDGPVSGRDQGCTLALSPEGGTVFLSTESEGYGTGSDYVVVAYDAATGEELWVSRYDGPASSSDYPGQLSVSPDGGTVFVSGGSPCTECDTDCATVAYDAATGEQLWVARYDSPGSLTREHCGQTAVGLDGTTLYVGGWYDELETGSDYLVVAYETSTGERIWTSRYDGPAWGGDGLRAMRMSIDGGMVVATGDSEGCGGGKDYATVAYDASTGDELWVARYNGDCSGWDGAASVAATPNEGTVVVTGYSSAFATGSDFLTVGYDPATGEERWVARYDGLAPALACDAGLVVSSSPDGTTVFVTGDSEGLATRNDYTTVAYLVVLPIEIDIKPENDRNPVNPRSHGVTPVALLGSETFDVTELDVTTLRFGPGEASPAHDLTSGWPYSDPLRDVNSDGFTDLLVHFTTSDTGIGCADTEATLTAQLLDGFPVRGTDAITTVGCDYRSGPARRTAETGRRRDTGSERIDFSRR